MHWQNLKSLSLQNQWPDKYWTKFDTKQSWITGIQVFINKELLPFPRGDDIEIGKYTSTKLQPHLEQLIFVWRGFKFVLSERQFYFLYGGNSDIVNINWRLLKTLFSITEGSISSNLGTIKAFMRKEDDLFLISIDKLVGQICWTCHFKYL